MTQTTLPSTYLPVSGKQYATLKAVLLFANFFLIILAYYQLKPAQKSLFITAYGADSIPYIWIATALFLGALVSWYQRLIKNVSRIKVVIGTLLVSSALLLLFNASFTGGSKIYVAAFYVFVDIFSVVLVEQFWSLANSINTQASGKKWYGLVGTGGLAGGAVGSEFANQLLRHHGLVTEDLLLVAIAILILLMALNSYMAYRGVYQELPAESPAATPASGSAPRVSFGFLFEHRYLLLIAAIVLLSQLVETFTEYQFSKMLERSFSEKEAVTQYSARFYAQLSMVAIAVNLLITPLVHRYLGVIPGLMAQPLAIAFFSMTFVAMPTLWVASMLKISDRGLSYSINRASKEILYIPINPLLIYQSKAWIDMFGYRLFKAGGALLIVMVLTLSKQFSIAITPTIFSWLSVLTCMVWLWTIAQIRRTAPSQPRAST